VVVLTNGAMRTWPRHERVLETMLGLEPEFIPVAAGVPRARGAVALFTQRSPDATA
jgi:hypothetical protein